MAAYADGWMPIYERYEGNPIDDLQRACDEAERDFSEMTVLLFGTPMEPDVVESYLKRGCDGFIFLPEPDRYDDIEGALDDIARFCERFKT